MGQLSKVTLVKGPKAHETIYRAVDLIDGLKDVAKSARESSKLTSSQPKRARGC